MSILKTFAVLFTFVCALIVYIIAWQKVPASKGNQRIYIYMAAFLLLVTSAVMLFSGPS